MSKIATRERILDAALSVFAGKGYHRATVGDIERASSTSKGAVSHHFPNKESLFLALADAIAAALDRQSLVLGGGLRPLPIPTCVKSPRASGGRLLLG